MSFHVRALFGTLSLSLVLAGCGGGGSSNNNNPNPPPPNPGVLSVSPQSMTFSSTNAASQTGTISFTGNVGQASINEDTCIGQSNPPVQFPSGPKIAYLVLNGTPTPPPGGLTAPISLPATFTVTPYPPPNNVTGTCQIFFNPQFGTGTVMTVTVNP